MIEAVSKSLKQASIELKTYGSPLPVPFFMRLAVLALTGKDVALPMRAFNLLEVGASVVSDSEVVAHVEPGTYFSRSATTLSRRLRLDRIPEQSLRVKLNWTRL